MKILISCKVLSITLVNICRGVHSIDGLKHPFIPSGIVPYLVEEGPTDLTLIDTCFLKDVPKLETYLRDIDHSIEEINRIVLTHVHIDVLLWQQNENKRIDTTLNLQTLLRPAPFDLNYQPTIKFISLY